MDRVPHLGGVNERQDTLFHYGDIMWSQDEALLLFLSSSWSLWIIPGKSRLCSHKTFSSIPLPVIQVLIGAS